MNVRDTSRPPRASMPTAGLYAALRVFLAAGVELALFYALPLHDPDVSPLGLVAPHRHGARRNGQPFDPLPGVRLPPAGCFRRVACGCAHPSTKPGPAAVHLLARSA
jgi:hypothetical protein